MRTVPLATSNGTRATRSDITKPITASLGACCPMRKTHTIPLSVRFAGPEAEGEFAGIAATLETDRHGTRFAPGAFAASLADWRRRGALPPLLWAHDPGEPIGALLTAQETDAGLEVTGRLALGTGNGRRAHELLKTGPGALGLSVGFIEVETDYSGPVPIFREVDWLELSLVATPSQAGAVVTQVRAADRFNTRKEFEHAARQALGLSANEAKRLAAGGWGALARQEQDDEPDQRATALAAALTRIANTRI